MNKANTETKMYYYQGGFYDKSLHGDISPDAAEITKEYWLELIEGQSSGKQITEDENGYPVLAEIPVTEADYINAREDHILQARIERGYTTREPSEYNGSSVARWAQDAEDFIKFRDECMLYGLQVQNDYAAGKQVLTLEEFKKNLPKIEWTYADPEDQNLS